MGDWTDFWKTMRDDYVVPEEEYCCYGMKIAGIHDHAPKSENYEFRLIDVDGNEVQPPNVDPCDIDFVPKSFIDPGMA